jgi:hypothetical protein
LAPEISLAVIAYAQAAVVTEPGRAARAVRGLSLTHLNMLRWSNPGAGDWLYQRLAVHRDTPRVVLDQLCELYPNCAPEMIALATGAYPDHGQHWRDSVAYAAALPRDVLFNLCSEIAALTLCSEAPERPTKPETRKGRDQVAERPEETFRGWIWGIRRHVSLLLANGHPRAADYPISMVGDEALLIEQRLNAGLADASLMTQCAIGGALSTEGHQQFERLVNELRR